jgi:hypothetical protein
MKGSRPGFRSLINANGEWKCCNGDIVHANDAQERPSMVRYAHRAATISSGTDTHQQLLQ